MKSEEIHDLNLACINFMELDYGCTDDGVFEKCGNLTAEYDVSKSAEKLDVVIEKAYISIYSSSDCNYWLCDHPGTEETRNYASENEDRKTAILECLIDYFNFLESEK